MAAPSPPGWQNPLSLAFDNQGNLYVGQQTTPYIAEFSATGQRLADIGPVHDRAQRRRLDRPLGRRVHLLLHHRRAPTSCATTCAPTRRARTSTWARSRPRPLDGTNRCRPTSSRSCPNGDVLVADSNAVVLLDQNGNVLQTYPCSSSAGLPGPALRHEPRPRAAPRSGPGTRSRATSGRSTSPPAQVHADDQHQPGLLYGLSVDDEIKVAARPPVVTATPTTLSRQPGLGQLLVAHAGLGRPDQLRHQHAHRQRAGDLHPQRHPRPAPPTPTAPGRATCVITPGEPSSSYTLTASFARRHVPRALPIGSDSSSSTFTVNPDTSSVTYTGPTTAVNGQPVTLTGTLTTEHPDAGHPAARPRSSRSPWVRARPRSPAAGRPMRAATSAAPSPPSTSRPVRSPSRPASAGTSTRRRRRRRRRRSSPSPRHSWSTRPRVTTPMRRRVSGVLTDSVTNAPISGEPVTLKLNGTETCTATTDSTGTASCTITPGETAGTYSLSGQLRR